MALELQLPTEEAHYLTREGDVVAALCRKYYGFEYGAAEAVYRRNPFLSNFGGLLPAMMLIVFPVVERPVEQNVLIREIPNRTYYTPPARGTQTTAAASQLIPTTFAGSPANNAPVADYAEYIAVYVRNAAGDFVLRRVPRGNFGVVTTQHGQYTGLVANPQLVQA